MKTLLAFTNAKLSVLAIALVATFLLPGLAKAQFFVLDTGTPPTNDSTIYSLLNSDSYGAEFSATAGETVTTLSAYISSVVEGGDFFNFVIYSPLRTTGDRVSPIESFQGTYTASGWNSTTVNWVVPTTGNYYLALQCASGNEYDLPAESSTGTGTVPATSFIVASANTYLYSTSSNAIGLEVAAQAAPEPSSAALLVAGGIALLAFWRKRARA